MPGGPFTMGTSTEPWALDNERPAHTVQVAPFYLDTTPVTCGAYAQFIDDGGYDDPRWWTGAGWEHRQNAGLTAPLYWRSEGRQWTRRVFGRQEPIVPNEPVLHVSWYEADAYARWAGRRLPTEAEWEKAARFDPATGLTRRYPWGNADPDTSYANLGQAFLRPAPAGSYPAGAAPCGARQLIGDVWEWTSSDFLPYPGFEAWPYKEYSEVFFGPEYKVMRGGSFAVSPVACRGTFRNWDYPIRRQIFAGFRTARSGGAGDRLMCRHLAYLGPPASLRSVLIDPPHGLYRQAWAPRRQRHGTVNADGFGVGWYAPDDPDPARYRRAVPIWGDESFADVARVTSAARCWRRCAARPRAPTRGSPRSRRTRRAAGCSATTACWTAGRRPPPGWPRRCPPGRCSGWRPGWIPRCCGRWSGTGSGSASPPRTPWRTPSPAVRAAGVSGRFNFLLTDGRVIAATAAGDTLCYRARGTPWSSPRSRATTSPAGPRYPTAPWSPRRRSRSA